MSAFNWYVSYKPAVGGATEMSLFFSKEDAIAISFQMLERSLNVIEIGPLRTFDKVLRSEFIRDLHTAQLAARPLAKTRL